MTTEERKELAIHLRQMSRNPEAFYSPDALHRAANEIEWLINEVQIWKTKAATLDEALAKESRHKEATFAVLQRFTQS